jgi:hypothetical protein
MRTQICHDGIYTEAESKVFFKETASRDFRPLVFFSSINGLNHFCRKLRIRRVIRKYKRLCAIQHSAESTRQFLASISH